MGRARARPRLRRPGKPPEWTRERPPYTLGRDGQGAYLDCALCATRSRHPVDVQYRFCLACFVFLDELIAGPKPPGGLNLNPWTRPRRTADRRKRA